MMSEAATMTEDSGEAMVSATDDAAPRAMSILAMADLQDQLLSVVSDLSRLQSLLGEACGTLLERFHNTGSEIQALAAGDAAAAARAQAQIAGAVTGLQFQDLASQLLEHAAHRLVHCGDRLAAEAFGQDDDGAAVIHQLPSRPNPVTQSEMVAGSVDLF